MSAETEQWKDRIHAKRREAERSHVIARIAEMIEEHAAVSPFPKQAAVNVIEGLYKLFLNEALPDVMQLAQAARDAATDFGPYVGMNPRQHHPGNILRELATRLHNGLDLEDPDGP